MLSSVVALENRDRLSSCFTVTFVIDCARYTEWQGNQSLISEYWKVERVGVLKRVSITVDPYWVRVLNCVINFNNFGQVVSIYRPEARWMKSFNSPWWKFPGIINRTVLVSCFCFSVTTSDAQRVLLGKNLERYLRFSRESNFWRYTFTTVHVRQVSLTMSGLPYLHMSAGATARMLNTRLQYRRLSCGRQTIVALSPRLLAELRLVPLAVYSTTAGNE